MPSLSGQGRSSRYFCWVGMLLASMAVILALSWEAKSGSAVGPGVAATSGATPGEGIGLYSKNDLATGDRRASYIVRTTATSNDSLDAWEGIASNTALQ